MLHHLQRMYRAKYTGMALLFALLIGAVQAQAQTKLIKGQVLSAQDEAPLPGVTVQVKGTSNGTTTDNEGKFHLNASEGQTLVFTYLGFLKKEVQVDGQSTMRIQLQPNVKELNSVVVVGYGTQKKENLTGSVETVDMTEKAGQPITNASNALHGAAGLFVNLSNSQPGVDRANILIRGMGTLNNSDPLVMVDGIEYPMDEINPDDIATITVLKDASAAIYGSRAANGVILITTKKGKGKSHVNYNYYYGVQNPTRMPDAIWDPIAYMKLKDQAELNEGNEDVDYSDAEIKEYQDSMATNHFVYPASNWFDIALEPGKIQKHNLSFSGSNEKTSYRLGLGYQDRDGIIIGDADLDKKYSLSLDLSSQVGKRLTVGGSINGYYRYYTEPSYSTGSFFQYLMRALPILPDTLADGNYGYPWTRTPGRNNWEHPRMIAQDGSYRKYVQRFLATVYADYKLPFNLSYHIKFGADKYDGFLKRFIPQMFKEQAKSGHIYNWNSPSTAPRAYNYDYNSLALHFYNTLNWKHSFTGGHELSLMAGASYDNFDDADFMAEMTGYLDASLTALDAGTIRQGISGSSTKDVLESYFGRLNYNYKGKYLLDATFRYDGSSRFAPGHRWGFFPGVSAGWRIDREAFFQSNLINLLKLRASVGQLGNQAVALYSYENSITLGHDYSFGGSLAPGAASTAYSDPNTSWETTTDYDLGLDINFLQNKISVTADVYKRRTSGILRTVNLPAQVGDLTGPKENVGTVDNKGIELSVQYRNNIGDFNYSFNGNVAYNKNEVVDLGGQILYDYGTNLSTITQKGYPIDAFYLLHSEGLFQSDAEVEKSAFQTKDTKAGYIKYEDVNGDGKINGDDRKILSSYSSVIPKYTYGFGVNLGYKGFSLNAFFQGVAGLKIYPEGNIAFPFYNGANATWEWLNNSWTPDNPNATLPIVTESTGKKGSFQDSDFWLRDGSYMRLKNIQLSYALPYRWLEKIKISKLSVFVNGENLATFSKYKDFDPESIVNYSSLYHYPMLKTVSAGVNVTF